MSQLLGLSEQELQELDTKAQKPPATKKSNRLIINAKQSENDTEHSIHQMQKTNPVSEMFIEDLEFSTTKIDSKQHRRRSKAYRSEEMFSKNLSEDKPIREKTIDKNNDSPNSKTGTTDNIKNENSKSNSRQYQSEWTNKGEWANWNIEKLKVVLENIEYEDNEQMVIPQPQVKQKRRPGRITKQPKIERGIKQEGIILQAVNVEREKVKRERERNIEMVNQFLSGKATFMWLFILGDSTNESQLQSVRQIYQQYFQNDYQVPLCRNYSQALRFLSIESCFFKVVADLQQSQTLIKEIQKHKNIVTIYIYNSEKESGASRAFDLKRSSKKVRGMFMDIESAVKIAQEEIENEAKFISVGDDLYRDKNRLRFPAFFILNGVDNSEVTAYRLSLFATLRLTAPKQREIYLKQFTDIVQLRYSQNKSEMKNLAQYKLIDHIHDHSQQKYGRIIHFYVKQTFYYGLVNAMLRISRNSEQFRPCAIPFNETYHSIKHYYKKYLSEQKQRKEPIIVYRGAKLRNSDVKCLKVGSFIELLGFTSTSLNRRQAEKFMDNDSYLIEIHVNIRPKNDIELDYDHGFIEVNRYGLAAQAFQGEDEVLFNALNVYRVIGLDLQPAIRKITLSYGGVIEVMRKQPGLQNEMERKMLQNYRHCINSYKQIQDDGDVMLLTQDHEKCIQYYNLRIGQGEKNSKNYAKLAGAHMEFGNLDAAYQNAIKSLERLDTECKDTSVNRALVVPIAKTSKVFAEKEDVVNYERSTNFCIQTLEDWEQKSKILINRAENKLKVGDFSGCLADLAASKDCLENKRTSFDKRRQAVGRKYFFSCLKCCFESSSQEKELQLLEIEQEEINFMNRADYILQQRLQIALITKDLFDKVGDVSKSQSLSHEIQSIFKQIKPKFDSQNNHEAANYNFLEACSLENKQFQKYEQFMEEAIDITKAENPYHQNVGKWSLLLGNKRYELIQAKLNQPKILDSQNKGNLFDYQDYKRQYKKCKLNNSEAISNFTYNKGTSYHQTLQSSNKLVELDFEFSLLKQAQQRAHQMVEGSQLCHSESAKCYVLLAKIALAKGELKMALSRIEQAGIILKSALVKSQTPQYNKVLMQHPLQVEIIMLRAKIYNRQFKHKLALKQLQIAKRMLELQKPLNSTLLATLLEERAEILVCLGETENFQHCVLKSVKMRQNAMGVINIPNAISYSNLFKYLRFTNDFGGSVKYHKKSIEIFSRFPPDHPNTWVLHLSNGMILYERQQFEEALIELQVGMRIAERRYSPNHINYMKIKLQFAKLLRGMGEIKKALQLLQRLELVVDSNIKESSGGNFIQKEADDEKFTVRRKLLLEMKQLYQRLRRDGEQMYALQGLERCQAQLKQHEQFLSQKLGSLKSLN